MESWSLRSSLIPWLVGVGVLGLALGAISWHHHQTREPVTMVHMPDRFTKLILEPPKVAPERESFTGNPSKPALVANPGIQREQTEDLAGAQLQQLIGTRGVVTKSGGLLGASGQLGTGGLGIRGGGIGGGGIGSALGTKGLGGSGGTFGYADPPERSGHIAAPVPNTEQYTDHGVSDFFITEQDRFSTFSVDVDTASYSVARAKLRGGRLPPRASVRTEEFVNSFDYHYPPPSEASAAPFRVHMEGAPHPISAGRHIVRIGIKGAEPDQPRTPLHLTFLVDVSGSMSSPDKLGLAQRSLQTLVEQLQDGDTVALVTYAGSVGVVLSPTDVSQQAVIHTAIDRLQAGGGTAMGSGMSLAYAQAQASFVTGHENRVIVLSDGDANIGPTSHAQIVTSIRGFAERGITLTTVGFGQGNYRDTMMEQLADEGDGNHVYIDSAAEAERVFVDKLGATLTTIARDVKLQVEFNPATVSAYRLIGYENRDIADNEFRNDAVDAGEVGRGHEVTALYELALVPGAEGELATVRVRAKPAGADADASEWRTELRAASLHRELADARRSTRLAFAAATFAEKLRGSPHAAEISWDWLRGFTATAIEPSVSHETELLELVDRAASLSSATVARN